MTIEERLNALRQRLPVDDMDNSITDNHLLSALDSAKYIIFEERFPFHEHPEDVESRYHGLQIRIALEIFNKEGAEGQTSHSENGISRTYSSADISLELLDKITPLCGV